MNATNDWCEACLDSLDFIGQDEGSENDTATDLTDPDRIQSVKAENATD